MTPPATRGALRRLRAFTLIELIVVILVLGILAALAVVGYGDVTDRAQTARATSDLRQVSTAVLARASLEQKPLTRALVMDVMADASGSAVHDGLTAAAWQLGTAGQTPTRPGQFAVGFDNFDQVAVDTAGARGALVTAGVDGTVYATVLTEAGSATAPAVVAPVGTTPAIVLGAIPEGGSAPVFSDDSGVVLPAPPSPTAEPEPDEVPLTPLAPPTGVVAEPGDASLAVTWSPVTDATSYTVAAAPVAGGAPTTCTSAGTSCTVTALTNGTAYLVSVTAAAADGRTAVSDAVTATPVAPITLTKLVAYDGAASDAAGRAVAVSGDTVVVGSAGDDSGQGSAYVYTRTAVGWALQQKVVAPDGAAGDGFAQSLDLDRDTLVVGAPRDDDKYTDTGSVYVFLRSGDAWVQQAKLTAVDPAQNDQFGTAVAVDGDLLVASAPYKDVFGSDGGRATVYTRVNGTWQNPSNFAGTGTTTGDRFGGSVDVHGTTVVVGSIYAYGGGAAYVLTRGLNGTWPATATKILTTDLAWGDNLGAAVAAGDGRVFVGADSDDDKGSASGAVYEFTRSGTGWTQTSKLVPQDGLAGDAFGSALAFDGTTLAVGAMRVDARTVDAGAVYLLNPTGSGWSWAPRVTTPDGDTYDNFGASVAVDGRIGIAGAYSDDDKGSMAGAAWVVPTP